MIILQDAGSKFIQSKVAFVPAMHHTHGLDKSLDSRKAKLR
ncbi:hypothetical protein S1OALGB6SA_1479 [Olavius algarvensis spirochete endosymbiont]|nr:MAG: hypothetical protein [Olavius algarvensis spirochete endosymbiont]VDB00401.1 hypothetical protein S1OALGB6SA_1479 [Olavius algarvensis spirochete endosymbiont]